jgi:hypothetical protein
LERPPGARCHNHKVSAVFSPFSLADKAQVDPNLKTFTIFNWTSTTRNIMTPYNLVFPLRPNDNQISPNEAKAVWNNIAENTLKGDDLTKFKQHLNDDSELVASASPEYEMSIPKTWTTLTTSALLVLIGSGRDCQLNEWLVSEALASHLNDLYGRESDAESRAGVRPLRVFVV